MPKLEVTTAGVKKLHENVQPKKASDTDQLPLRVHKEFVDVIAKPLRDVFLASLDTSTVSSQWKLTNVMPVSRLHLLQTK